MEKRQESSCHDLSLYRIPMSFSILGICIATSNGHDFVLQVVGHINYDICEKESAGVLRLNETVLKLLQEATLHPWKLFVAPDLNKLLELLI